MWTDIGMCHHWDLVRVVLVPVLVATIITPASSQELASLFGADIDEFASLIGPTRSLEIEDVDKAENGLRGRRGMLQRCGTTRNMCQSHLQCTRVPIGRVCLPVQCIEEVFVQELKQQNLQNVANEVLEQAGWLGAGQAVIFNQTTLQSGRLAVARRRGKYVLNEGVLTQLQQAIGDVNLNGRVDMDRIQSRVEQECTRTANVTTYTQDEFHWGLSFEASAGGKFGFHHLQYQENATHMLCLGAGPVVDIHFAFFLGWVFAANSVNDIRDCSWMVDAGANAALGAGIAAGFTTPSCKFKLELSGTTGIGGGFGAAGCFAVDEWAPFP